MPPKRTREPSAWSIATPPASYGEVDDSRLVRYVRVPRGSTLHQTKQIILHAYEDQYTPELIMLFTRNDKEELVRVTTDVAVKHKLLACDARFRTQHDKEDTSLLVVSAMNETESKLLVLPAVHSPPVETVLHHLEVDTFHDVDGVPSLLSRLATAKPSLFDALPLPSHVDDWLAQYKELPQPASEVQEVSMIGRNTIYVQPIECEVAGQEPSPPVAETALFECLRAYIAAFFTGIQTELRPALTVNIKKTSVSRGSGRLLGNCVGWRNKCPANGAELAHGQLDAGDLLKALKPRFVRGKIVGATGALPADGLCVLGVTMSDLFCADDDVFTGGLASLTHRAGVFSFHRRALVLQALHLLYSLFQRQISHVQLLATRVRTHTPSTRPPTYTQICRRREGRRSATPAPRLQDSNTRANAHAGYWPLRAPALPHERMRTS